MSRKPHKKWGCPCTDCQKWYRDALDRHDALLRDVAIAFDDWLHQYASEQCKPEHVAASIRRVLDAGGTLAYIAKLQREIKAELGD